MVDASLGGQGQGHVVWSGLPTKQGSVPFDAMTIKGIVSHTMMGVCFITDEDMVRLIKAYSERGWISLSFSIG